MPENDAADQAAGEIAGEVDSARHATIVTGRLSDETGRNCLRKKSADADEHHAGQNYRQANR